VNRNLRLWIIAVALLTVGVVGRRVTAQTRTTPFQVGDRILLHVEGDSALSDTFTVVAGPALRLPEIGEISLALIRVSVLGEVTRPGYYAVPVDLVLADALMVAGGATKDARVDQLRVLRGNSSLWSGNELQTEIARGATLDQLGIRAGDRIQVPGHRDAESTWRIVGIVVGSLATAVGVIALTHR